MKEPTPETASRAQLLSLVVLLALGLPLLPGCAQDADASSEPSEPTAKKSEVGKDIRDLVAALTPLAADAPPVELNQWHLTRKRLLERVRAMGPEWGTEALRVYHDRPNTYPEVRSGLLDAAAHTHPEGTTELLVELVTEFGEDLHIRTKACGYLAIAAPERAVEVLEPLIVDPPSGRTYPPRERMLTAWNDAASKVGLDRAPLLSAVATDSTNEMDLRHMATRYLGSFESRQGRQALELLMVESGGNTYIRRIATQSLVKTVPKEALCELVRGILDREADISFQVFLDNVLQENCR